MVRTYADFQKATLNDLELSKFCLDASGEVAVRYLQGISAWGNPVETFADLPPSGVIEGEARVVWNDPIMGSTLAIWNGSVWVELLANDFNRVAIDAGDIADYLGAKLAEGAGITLTTSAGPNKTITIAATGSGTDCIAVQNCIEAFTSLDLSGVAVTLGEIDGAITFGAGTTIDWTNTTSSGSADFGNTYIANYDGSVINITNNATMNIENSTYNSTNNEYNYAGDTIQYIDNTDISYDTTTNVTYEGDIYIGGNVVQMNNNLSTAGAVAQSGAGVAYTNLSNVLLCDGSSAIATPIDPTSKDSILLLVGGVQVGSDLAMGLTGGNPAIYGGTTNLRGTTLTPAQVNASDFGVSFAFGDSKYINVTDFGMTVPLTDTVLGVRVEIIFTSTANSVSVDCITMVVFHTAGVPITEAIKPSGLEATNSPTDGYMPVKATGLDEFTWIVAPGSQVDDTPYGGSWNGVTTIAPSKNAVYDKIQSMVITAGGGVIDASFMNGEDLVAGDYVFKERGPTFASATSLGRIGDTAVNTRRGLPIFFTDETSDTLYLALKKVGTPGVDLHLRIEGDSGGFASGSLIDPNATADIPASGLTTSLTDHVITLAGAITVALGTKAHIVLYQGTYGSETLDETNFYEFGYSSHLTTTRGLSAYKGGGRGSSYLMNDGFATFDSGKRAMTGSITCDGSAHFNGYPALRDNSLISIVGLDASSKNISLQGIVTGSCGTGGQDDGGFFLYQDANNYFGFMTEGTNPSGLGTVSLTRFEIKIGGVSVYATTQVYNYSQGKIEWNKDAGTVILYYYNAGAWHVGYTYSTPITGTWYAAFSGYMTNGTVILDNIYFNDWIYTTQIPVTPDAVGTLFAYARSTLFEDILLSKTNSNYAYKSLLHGVSTENQGAGSFPIIQMPVEGTILYNQTALTPGDSEYLASTPGTVANTPGVNPVLIGVAQTPTTIQLGMTGYLSSQVFSNGTTNMVIPYGATEAIVQCYGDDATHAIHGSGQVTVRPTGATVGAWRFAPSQGATVTATWNTTFDVVASGSTGDWTVTGTVYFYK